MPQPTPFTILLIGLAASLIGSVVSVRWTIRVSALAAFAILVILAGSAPRIAADMALFSPLWSMPSLGMAGGLRLDGLALVLALLIAGIGLLVFVYAGSYLHGDPKLRRLVVTLTIFMTAMLGSVMADDVIVLFVFWEMTSLASFFLIATNHENANARRCAQQALLVTGGGGLALLAGLLLIAIAAGTTSISGIIAAKAAVLAHPAALPAMLLVIVGCFTKSAQVPFHFWLPNAMVAPTPVSTYLHSATMVKLGVYLLARLNPVYQDEYVWQHTLTWFGLATAATAALLALRETDLKRVLAYTTVTALGTLVMLIGIAPEQSAVAAITFLVVHAFYKAALFMIAGIVDHETGTRDLGRLGGLARLMPVTAVAATLAALSMAGLPPFVGFVAKELILEAKLDAGPLSAGLIVLGFIANAATVAIAGVLSLRLFFGESRPTPETPHDPPWRMTIGPVVLAGLGLAFGAAPGVLGQFLVEPAASAVLGRPAAVSLKLWHGFTPVLLLSLVTMGIGILLFAQWERLAPRLKGQGLIDRLCPSRLYDSGMHAIVRAAERTTRLIQHGRLRDYLRTLFVVTGAGVMITLLARDGLALPAFDAPAIDWRAVAFLGIMVGAIAAAMAKSLLRAVMAMGLVGFASAAVFLFFAAPDLALTQFAVETLTIVILAVALSRLPHQRADDRDRRQALTDGAIALLVGSAATALLLAVLASPLDPRLGDWFGSASVPAAHGRNVVNVILVDFRALDTLGEITVLAIAAFAIVALLRSTRPEANR
ncbi:MAG: DUF4040 domain-containing protein [Hyphomicrobiaceae bacterium]|nr:DUF4040 domain-containing protein [Hyphomicrobiaceae bacterium]